MRYLCIDPRWSGGTPTPQIAGLYGGLRYVLFNDSWPQTSDYINGGWYVHGVLARESGDPAFFSDWGPPNFSITIGNEPDITSPSSWTLSPVEYGALWKSTNGYPAPRWIGGFASGDIAVAKRYLPYAHGAAGIDVHLYTLSPSEAVQRIHEYQSLGLPVRVGEWHPADGYRLTDYAFPVDAGDFCLSNQMVENMGLYQ
jgi:hypothetical protein